MFMVACFSGLVCFAFGLFLPAAAHAQPLAKLKQKSKRFHERISSEDEEILPAVLDESIRAERAGPSSGRPSAST
jgi:hypothetical protein